MLDVISLKDAERQTGSSRWQTRKSAGLAWLLSLVLPGAGHLYAGLYLRGAFVMGFSVVGLFVFVSTVAPSGRESNPFLGAVVTGLPILWVFGFLDAYMTTVEGNRGIDPSLVDNPRVAAVLNLTTSGLGYFYLGERTKGIAMFVAMSIASLLVVAPTSPIAVVISLLIVCVSVWISYDAYRLGRRAFEAQVAGMELPPPPRPSRVPPVIPYALAGVTAFVLLGLILTASLMMLLRRSPG